VESALRGADGRFPELLMDMVGVGERTGALPEVFGNLAEHYESNSKLRREFLQAIAWPVFQLGMAVLIIAGLILLLGWIAAARGGEPIDVLGLGLTGTAGAITWLLSVTMLFGGGTIAYLTARRSLTGRLFLDGLLLRVPVVGHCRRCFAIARFAWAFSLTQRSGMELQESLEASLKATGNGAFIDANPRIWRAVFSGENLTMALRGARLFPEDFLNMVDVAETSGTVPEALERLGPQFHDDARRSLTALVSMVTWGVWCLVATFIVFVVFRIAFWYIGMIDSALQEAL
jgi:type IV pilus assembly protein PilC